MVKNLPAMQETWVQSLGQEEPLEKGMATHSSEYWSIPIHIHEYAWRIPWWAGGLHGVAKTTNTSLSHEAGHKVSTQYMMEVIRIIFSFSFSAIFFNV